MGVHTLLELLSNVRTAAALHRPTEMQQIHDPHKRPVRLQWEAGMLSELPTLKATHEQHPHLCKSYRPVCVKQTPWTSHARQSRLKLGS